MKYRIVKKTNSTTEESTYYVEERFLWFFWKRLSPFQSSDTYCEANEVLEKHLIPPIYEHLKPNLKLNPKPTKQLNPKPTKQLNLEQYCTPIVVGIFEDGNRLTGKLFYKEGDYFIETLGVNVWHHESYGPFTSTGEGKENYRGPNLVKVQRVPHPTSNQCLS
jgi:hypothetical protein